MNEPNTLKKASDAAENAIKIPGNIKQAYLPFVLDQKSELHRLASCSEALAGIYPQLFSFRNHNDAKGGFGKLNICPSSYKKYVENDIANRLGYSFIDNYDSKQTNFEKITLDNLFQTLPGIQIREYQIDSRMDQALNLFGAVWDVISASFKDITMSGDGFFEICKSLGHQFWTAFTSALDYLFCISDPNVVSDLKEDLKKWFQSTGIYTNTKNELVDACIMSFPYFMYYKLQSCSTLNVYELPCKTSSKELYFSDGTKGWDGSSVGLTSAFDKIPGLGKVLGGLISGAINNIRVNFINFWDANEGSKTPAPEIEIKFDLFNDEIDAAIMNFIFVNTIVPNNRWVQYGTFQHPSSLYDIKLEGYNRLFACTGKFAVTYGGILRTPSPELINTLVSKHFNMNVHRSSGDASLFRNAILQNSLIKIPDIYHVTMKFQSLIPANANTYIQTYANNINVMNYATDSTPLTYQGGGMDFVLNRVSEGLEKHVKPKVQNIAKQYSTKTETKS